MTYRAFHRIPIYSTRFWVSIADDTVAARRSLSWAIPLMGTTPYPGLCSYDEGRVAVFFERKVICHELIAHELFHATHRIMQSTASNFFTEAQEPFAYLCGFLTDCVYRDIAKWKVKVHTTWPEPPTRSR